MKARWTKSEEDFLNLNYCSFTKDKLLEQLPNRSWDSIKLKANSLGLKFYAGTHPYVCADLSVLLEEDRLPYYWMGLLLADGSFCNSRLKLQLKDTDHVYTFAKFIKCKNIHKNKHGACVSVMDKYTVPLILKKFDIKKRKSYNPPDISWIEKDLFLAFLIGFIDGDGCIRYQYARKDCMMSIKNHNSWLQTHKIMHNKLCKMTGYNTAEPKVTGEGYSVWNVGNRNVLRFLKKKAESLPVLARKWSKI